MTDEKRHDIHATQEDFHSVALTALAAHQFLTTRQVGLLVDPSLTRDAVHKRLSRSDDFTRLVGYYGVTCWTASQHGLRRIDSPFPVLERIGAATARHGHVTAEIAIGYGNNGLRIATERHLQHVERQRRETQGLGATPTGDGSRGPRLMPDGSRAQSIDEWLRAWQPEHRPDLMVKNGDRWSAIEVELSRKSPSRLADKLAWYRRSMPSAPVYYLCGNNEVARAVTRAASGISKVGSDGSFIQVGAISSGLLARAVSP